MVGIDTTASGWTEWPMDKETILARLREAGIHIASDDRLSVDFH